MLKIENAEVMGWEPAIRGMRNPMNSWEKSDSEFVPSLRYEDGYIDEPLTHIGPDDLGLMTRLRNAGTDHRKFMRMITVYLDITAPLYWWKEFDTYKVGTVANSCSTMHKIHAKEFTLEDFSCNMLMDNCGLELEFTSVEDTIHLAKCSFEDILRTIINALNFARKMYLETGEKCYWWQMIQLLPSSYNQKRTVMLNYEVLANIYKSRRNHKLDEWHTLCNWIEELPYSELITGYEEEVIDKFNSIGNINAVSPKDITIGIDLSNGKDFTNYGKEEDNG